MQSRSRSKVALAAVLSAAAIGSLTGCGSPAADASGQVTITVWTRASDTSLKQQAAEFEKENPDIKVQISGVEDDQYMTKFANAVRAGSVPDLIDFDMIDAPLLATQGQLTDITDKAKSLPNYSSIIPAGIQNGSLNGKIYSLPIALTGSQMFWNKDLFTQAGLDPNKPPTTLAEVKTDAQKIQALGGGVTGFSTIGGTGQAFTGFPSGWADGGSVFTGLGPDQKATFDNPQMVDMLTWYQGMWNDGLMQKTDQPNQDPGNVGSQNALNGKVGIIFTGASTFAGHESEFGAAAGIPGNSGKLASFLGGNQAAIPVGAKHPDQAWTFLKWLVTDKDAAQIGAQAGWISPDLTLADQVATTDWDKTTIDSLKVGQLPESIAYSATVNDPNGPWAQHSQAVIFNNANPKKEMEQATKEANQLISDAYSQVG